MAAFSLALSVQKTERALNTNLRCTGMEISVKNMPDSIFFTSHIYMTLAILCRRRHKVAFIAELNLKFSSRFLRH